MHRATEQELRTLKVGYRARSIKRVTAAIVDGEIDEFALRQQSREEQRQALLALYGIGPASVGYILVDVFHQIDELSHISPWEQKIYSRLFLDRIEDDPAPVNELLAYFERDFAGYRALAVHYFWEDLFWRWKQGDAEWLDEFIRL
jgi:3-methyladenine DNA glycosylase/8-oxoguanine DNA glycosylase